MLNSSDPSATPGGQSATPGGQSATPGGRSATPDDPEKTAVIPAPDATAVLRPAVEDPDKTVALPEPAAAEPTTVAAAAKPPAAVGPTAAKPPAAVKPTAAEPPAATAKPAAAEPTAEETQVIRLPTGTTSRMDTSTKADETQVIRPSVPAADETQIIPAPKPKPQPAADETQVLPAPAAKPKPKPKPSADETQIITAPATSPAVTAIIPVVPGAQEPTATPAETTPAPVKDPARPPRPARRRPPLEFGHAPVVLVMSALGVLMVALAYAGGRIGTGNATIAYWIGQVVVFTPVVVRLLSRRMAGAAESFLLVMGLGLNQYLLKWFYSPEQFRFPDELQHWLGTTIILESGKLFQPNPALPPAVHFPGLAEMGAAVAALTGLPVEAAGIVVAGVARLVFVATLFAVVLRASRSPAVAGVCCAIYATALHYLFFNSSYLYQTAALPFLILTVWSTRRWRSGGGPQFLAVAVASIMVTTVSHHVTAFALVLTLFLLAAVELFLQKPRRWSALVVPGIAVAVVALWIGTVATDVVSYLEAPIDQVAETVRNLVAGTSEASSTTASVSIGQLALQGIGLIGLFVLYLALLRDMLQRSDRDPWRWAAIAGGALFFAGNGVRFLGQNGPEIAGRLSTFTYVPISIVAAIALVRGVQLIPARDADGKRHWRAAAPAIDYVAPGNWNLYSRVAAGSLMITILMIGARAGGWPPIGSILPGPYLAGAFERSVDVYGVSAAYWERDTLGHGNRVGGDITSVSLASTYGRQDPVREVGTLYYATTWSLEDEQLVSDLQIQYLVVDKRLGELLPQDEAYFENDPHAGSITSPLTSTQLGKFDTLPEVDRLYDNGTVRVYRMGNL
ncbi:hypothetical protein [Symbioplanes lichenis]|uniref:hypothetical protein n=1 Tax=Symbioplanes lichenis TaxID=1629072 RepID=UPI0027391F5F|nr:hypothetical protein [Actinoplanes lichenis]